MFYSVIRKAQFADSHVAMHWAWIDQGKALHERLERVRHERASLETKSYYEVAQEQFRDKYQQMTMDELEEEISRFGFKDSFALFEQIVFLKVLTGRTDRELTRPQIDSFAEPVGVMPSGEAEHLQADDLGAADEDGQNKGWLSKPKRPLMKKSRKRSCSSSHGWSL